MNYTRIVLNAFQTAAKTIALSAALIAALAVTTALISAEPRNYSASIVKVLNFEGTGGGTGWIAKSGDQNVIVTNHHVCEVARGGYARIEDDQGQPYIKRVLRSSFEWDLCVLEGIEVRAMKLAKAGPNRFDTVNVYGHPGLRPTAPATGAYTGPGIIGLGLQPDENGQCPASAERVPTMFGVFCVLDIEIGYTTVPIMPGNSGSPVTNENGEVVGVMNSADTTGNQGMFIPLPYVKEILGNQ